MEEKDVSYLSVEEVDRQQIEISLITGVLGVLGGIIAALLGGTVLSLVGSHQYNMMNVAAVSLVIGACCVYIIRTKKETK